MNKRQRYQPMPTSTDVSRREFVRIGAASAYAPSGTPHPPAPGWDGRAGHGHALTALTAPLTA